MMTKRKAKTEKINSIAVIDFETDPFLYGRVPAPFCAGFYSLDHGFKVFWGDDCVIDLVGFLESIPEPLLIYAHNGGKFDFHFLLDHLSNPLKIISSRIAQVKIGVHELRDSYSIIPIPLAVYAKDTIDYALMERDKREENKDEIISYLKTDCIRLYELVFKFLERFGINLTIGGTAIKILREMHPFDSTQKTHDDRYRPFYFGGRVEAFRTGIHRGKWRVFDVNSMYPYVMRDMRHPTGRKYTIGYNRIVDKRGNIAGFANSPFYFAKITCQQRGAFPVRVKNEPLNFDIPSGEFYVTSHELKAAMACGRCWNVKALEVYVPSDTISFGDYVDRFMADKISAKKSGDKAAEIFAKLLLNSAYGKFGQNPEHYYDYHLGDMPEDNNEWEIFSGGIDTLEIWRKKSSRQAYYDVATAASVTGAARSVLMMALSKSIEPVYCDTDSIICEDLDVTQDASALGAWKLEAEGDTVAIAGKKMYALRSGKDYVKTASKGVILTGPELFDLCRGKAKQWRNMAPSFRLGHETKFISRTIAGR